MLNLPLTFLLLLAFSAPAFAADKAPQLATPGGDKTFTFRIPGEPETLDWNRAHTMIETYLLMNLMEGLLTLDSDLKPQPSLAESWTVSKDGKTYTFKLRAGVKWSDGVPLKAQDFVYSWKRLLSPLTAASYAYFLFDVEGAEDFNRGANRDFSKVGISAPDDSTFVVKLNRPVAHWIYVPTFWVTFPLRQDVVDKHGSAWETPGRMITVGPFTLTAHDIDSKIVMRANPNYWGKRGNVEQVVGLIVKDDSAAMNLYDSGKLDFLTDISTLDLKRLEGHSDLKTFPYLKTGYLGYTLAKYPMSNVRVRRAIGMAIDRSKIGSFLHGGQQAATSFVPPKLLGHSPKGGLKYDPAAAKEELKKSGLDLSRVGSITLELICPNWDKQVTLAQYLQSEIKKNLGFQVEIQPFDHKTFRANLDLHAHALFEGSWSADYPDPDNFLSIFLSQSGNNRTTWRNKQFDEWVLQARGLQDAKKRAALYDQAQRLLLEDDAVVLPLYYEPNKGLVRARVKGLELNPLNYLLLKKVTLGSS